MKVPVDASLPQQQPQRRRRRAARRRARRAAARERAATQEQRATIAETQNARASHRNQSCEVEVSMADRRRPEMTRLDAADRTSRPRGLEGELDPQLHLPLVVAALAGVG